MVFCSLQVYLTILQKKSDVMLRENLFGDLDFIFLFRELENQYLSIQVKYRNWSAEVKSYKILFRGFALDGGVLLQTQKLLPRPHPCF